VLGIVLVSDDCGSELVARGFPVTESVSTELPLDPDTGWVFVCILVGLLEGGLAVGSTGVMLSLCRTSVDSRVARCNRM